jgi:hypothetical protein
MTTPTGMESAGEDLFGDPVWVAELDGELASKLTGNESSQATGHTFVWHRPEL